MDKVSKLNVSGLRGIWPESLNEAIITDYVSAFARFVKKTDGWRILIGRDGRATGPQIREIVVGALSAEGMEITDGGILPTPTVIFSAREMKFDGAVIITASHNPIEYNGLKFINGKSFFTDENEVREIESLCVKNDQKIFNVDPQIISDNTLISQHIKVIVEKVSVSAIRARHFKVTADPVNASGCLATPELLRELGCESFIINGEPTGAFARPPEPLPANLGDLAQAVLKNKADIGFAQDPDADRLVVVNEKGQVLSEEFTLALAVESVLSLPRSDLKNSQGPTFKSNIVTNLSTSRVIDDIARKYGARVARTKIGEVNVVRGILEHKAVIGGEGNGGVIYPEINLARDSLTGMALILDLLAIRQKTVSEIIATFPHYFGRKEKFELKGNIEMLYQTFLKKFPEAQSNTLDGLRLDFPDKSWFHIRPSNTEPILRVIGEAPNQSVLDRLFADARVLVT